MRRGQAIEKRFSKAESVKAETKILKNGKRKTKQPKNI
jgi:hypothetical protein